jgi:hypothetical protein
MMAKKNSVKTADMAAAAAIHTDLILARDTCMSLTSAEDQSRS